jgi:hypothetical protein
MRNKIIKVFIERKKKSLINDMVNIDPNSKSDHIQQHMIQKPIQSGYSINIP